MKERITMEYIAEKLGISKSLVSLALSDKYGVNEETREKIVLFALQAGYDLSSRRKLIRQSKINVAAVINSRELFTDMFWSEILAGFEKHLTDQKANLNIVITGDSVNLSDVLLKIMDSGCAGFCVFSGISTPTVMQKFGSLKMPIVLVDSNNYVGPEYDHVTVNNYSGGNSAAEYLAAKGFTDICFVSDITYALSFRQRYYGFKDFFSQYKDINVTYITEKAAGDPIIATYNRPLIRQYLLSKDRKKTAVMCANDPTAIRIYELCKKCELTVGQDVFVMGFDNTKTCEHLVPPLTSVNVPKTEMGMMAADLLLNRIKSPGRVPALIQLSTEIIERGSTIMP